MFILELCYLIPAHSSCTDNEAAHALHSLLASWRMNGQIIGTEHGIARADSSYTISVICPEATALHEEWDNKYVRAAKAEIQRLELLAQPIRSIGYDIEAMTLCCCQTISSFILMTHYLSMESPVRCGDCFCPIPLYRLPKTYDDEYYNIIVWQSDYQACDRLFMNSRVLERATNRELSRFHSKLSQDGYALCRQLEKLTGIPVYYSIKTHYGRSQQQEQQRQCPACGGPWLLEEAWHAFDFKCESCRLLSNIAYSI